MNREGVVLKVKGNKAVIMTPDGQFVSVAVSGRAPAPGEIYSGKIVGRNNALIRYLAMAAAFIFALFSFSAVKLYYTAYASVIIDINPSIELTINRWEKIIKAVPLDEDGSKILSTVKVNNDSINEGLKKIVDESIRQDFFDEANVESDKKISISVYINRSDGKIDLSEFEEYLVKENVKYELRQERIGIKQDSAGKQQRDVAESDGKGDKSEEKNRNGNNKDDKNNKYNGNAKGNVNNRNNGSNRDSGSNKDDEDNKEKRNYKYNKNKKEDEDSKRNGNDKEKDNKKGSKWEEKENEYNKGSRNGKEGWNNKDNDGGRGSWSNKASEGNKERNENNKDNRNSRGNSRNDRDKKNYGYKAGENLRPSILALRWQKAFGRLRTRSDLD